MSTKIEWCDETWNPITGCTPISTGCENCYAKRMANRLKGRFGYPEIDPFAITVHQNRLNQPGKWKKPRKIFVCSMGDLFHEDVYCVAFERIMYVAYYYQQHTFMFLTKRPKKMLNFFKIWSDTHYKDTNSHYLSNVWLGVSVENQETADERIPILLEIPAAIKFVSCEPLLGPIDFYHPGYDFPGLTLIESLSGKLVHCDDDYKWTSHDKIDWVICGPETGPGARKMELPWIRSIRNQCNKESIPFFYKGKSLLDGLRYHQFPKNNEKK